MYDSDMYFVIMVLFVMKYEATPWQAMLDWEQPRTKTEFFCVVPISNQEHTVTAFNGTIVFFLSKKPNSWLI